MILIVMTMIRAKHQDLDRIDEADLHARIAPVWCWFYVVTFVFPTFLTYVPQPSTRYLNLATRTVSRFGSPKKGRAGDHGFLLSFFSPVLKIVREYSSWRSRVESWGRRKFALGWKQKKLSPFVIFSRNNREREEKKRESIFLDIFWPNLTRILKSASEKGKKEPETRKTV